jgi:hypothetical protein
MSLRRAGVVAVAMGVVGCASGPVACGAGGTAERGEERGEEPGAEVAVGERSGGRPETAPEGPAVQAPEAPAELPEVSLEDAPDVPADDGGSPGACAEVAPRATVWPRPGPAAVAPAGAGFLVAGYAPDGAGGEEVFVARVGAGASAQPVSRHAMDRASAKRVAAPGLWVDGRHAWLARVDGAGALGLARFAHGQAGAPLRFEVVAEGVDPRFAPALAPAGDGVVVAWVDGRGTPMRVRVARVDLRGEVRATHDVTLEAMGGTAPAFVVGASPPVLAFVDARAGMSPLVRVPFDGDGTPGSGRVALTVGQVPEPPALAAARAPHGEVVAYTAIGTGATTAVGMVRLDAPAEGPRSAPIPLVKGTGYGTLGVAAAALPTSVLFASEAPRASTSEGKKADPPPRHLQLHLADGQGATPAMVLHTPGASTKHPALALGHDRRTVALAHTTDAAVKVAFLRCTPPQ